MINKREKLLLLGAAVCALTCFAGCKKQDDAKQSLAAQPARSTVQFNMASDGVLLSTSKAEFRLAPNGYLQAALRTKSGTLTLDEPSGVPGIVVDAGKGASGSATFDVAHATVREATGKLGALGKQVEVLGKIAGSDIEEQLTLELYDDFPGVVLLSARVRNAGQKDIHLENVSLQQHRFTAPPPTISGTRPMWTFEGSSLKWGKDEAFALPAKFTQENPMGLPVDSKDDLGSVGGGIPVVAFWNHDVGEAIGHVETLPLVLSIPVTANSESSANAVVKVPANATLKPGEIFSTPRTFLSVHAGDFYEPLNTWSRIIDKEGLPRPANNDENYAVSWCGWGYEFGVTPKQMLDTVPKIKELGIHWATLDDGWFSDYGDWQPRGPEFAGDAIPKLVKDFHQQGIKVQLWWLPLAVEDGHYGYGGRKYIVSDVVKQHPEWLVLNKEGKPARMARNLATLCPALPEVQAYHKQLTECFIRDWDFDGHKLDNIWTVPPCYNPAHHHKSPYDSIYAMGDVYKVIFETTRALKKDSVTQICPCGTPPSVAWFRFMDQAVTADPVGSVQVRRRIKMYKALLGSKAAIYGDHVELTKIANPSTAHEVDMGDDFASTVGVGGVPGTKFTWPDYGAKFKPVFLTPEREAHWKQWLGIYNSKMLANGDFLNLYVYGYDQPEAYVIEKGGRLYYAFYAPAEKNGSPGHWSGEIELRGLAAKSYKVSDYVNQKDLGTVAGPTAKLKVEFTDHLLLEAVPTP